MKPRARIAGATNVQGGHREIVPDYARPTALMVPHCDAEIAEFLEAIAAAAAQAIGVILLADDPERAQRFVAAQPDPSRYSIVGARYDTPWIRDRAPISVMTPDGVDWVLPRLPDSDRAADDRLFGAISARPTRPAPFLIAQGNLVAGPDGLALSTARVLQENNLRSGADMMPLAEALGIRHWIVFEPFPDEPTGHADVHVRFLRPDLMAVAWHADEPELIERATAIEAQVRSLRPSVRSVRIPCRRRGGEYASLVNWVQLGDDLLVPRFEITPDKDLRRAERRLHSEGFRVRTVFAPTLALGGSIHCLTASVVV